MDTRLARFTDMLDKYAFGYQQKNGTSEDALIVIEFYGNNDVVKIYYLVTPGGNEPVPMPSGSYWYDGTVLRKCIANIPDTSGHDNTYATITGYAEAFNTSLVLKSEYVDVDGIPGAPLPPSQSAKGSIQVNDGRAYRDLPVGNQGDGLVVNGNSPLGVFWSPIVTLSGQETLMNKSLSSPVINGFVSGNAVLDETGLTSNSNRKLATQRSIRNYVDTAVSAIAAPVFLSPTPGWDATSPGLPGSSQKGETYFVTVAGNNGGVDFNVGDMLIAKVDGASTSNLGDWLILNTGPLDPSLLTWMDVIDEDDMVSDLADKIPTQQSVKAFVEAEIGNLAGPGVELSDTPDWDASTGSFPVTSSKGNMFFCTTEGVVDNLTFNVGDSIIAKQDSASSTDSSEWVIIAPSANTVYLTQYDLLDEDDMSSDSDAKIPTQQSVKTFVEGKQRTYTIDGTFDTDGRENYTDVPVVRGIAMYDGYITATSVLSDVTFSTVPEKTVALELAVNETKLTTTTLNLQLDGLYEKSQHKDIAYEFAGFQVFKGDIIELWATTTGVDFPAMLQASVSVKLDPSA